MPTAFQVLIDLAHAAVEVVVVVVEGVVVDVAVVVDEVVVVEFVSGVVVQQREV